MKNTRIEAKIANIMLIVAVEALPGALVVDGLDVGFVGFPVEAFDVEPVSVELLVVSVPVV